MGERGGLQRTREDELANVVVDFLNDEVRGLDIDQVGPARDGVEVVVLQGFLQEQLIFRGAPVRARAHDVDSAFAHELYVADQKGREGLHVHVAQQVLLLVHLCADGAAVFGCRPFEVDDVLQDLAVRVGEKGVVSHVLYVVGFAGEAVACLQTERVVEGFRDLREAPGCSGCCRCSGHGRLPCDDHGLD